MKEVVAAVMSSYMRYGALSAKVRAMYGKRLRFSDFEHMAAMPSVRTLFFRKVRREYDSDMGFSRLWVADLTTSATRFSASRQAYLLRCSSKKDVSLFQGIISVRSYRSMRLAPSMTTSSLGSAAIA